MSSVLVANGTPPRLLALLDPLADLTDALLASGRAAVSILGRDQRRLAEIFAGETPAPGGAFSQAGFAETEWGPVPVGCGTWAGVRLEGTTEVGWSSLVTAVIEHLIVVEGGDDPLLHYRGGYPRLT